MLVERGAADIDVSTFVGLISGRRFQLVETRLSKIRSKNLQLGPTNVQTIVDRNVYNLEPVATYVHLTV
jgi:hypothetical protein